MSHLMRLGFAAVALTGLVALGGCSETRSNGSERITARSVRSDMSPELESIGESHQSRMNRYARVNNTNARQIHDDWDTIWLMDKPSQMSRYPIPGR